MITLHSTKNSAIAPVISRQPYIARVTTNSVMPEALRNQYVLHWKNPAGELPQGFKLVIVSTQGVSAKDGWMNVVEIDPALNYLSNGDIVRFSTERLGLKVLYRVDANASFFLLTERCNSFCLMCSQPPKDINDDYLVDEVLQAIPLVPQSTRELGFTGGEPTLLGDNFFKLVRATRQHLPRTSLHILSNGRNFQDLSMAERVAEIKHPDLMIGIPIYADYSQQHDFIVQADNAFDETIRGILNLKRCRVPVEIRVVIHKQNYKRLPKIAEFLARNLLFVDKVALMGLEMTGFTRANLDALWVDPFDYQKELAEAVNVLRRYKMKVQIYNHQLCLVPESIRPYSVKSISDWKNEYMPECNACVSKSSCGGFFSSAKLKYSNHINPFL